MLAQVLTAIIPGLLTPGEGEQVPSPPKTRRVDITEELHGIKVKDPYRWLEEQHSPATREWINQQNKYSRPLLEKFPHRLDIESRLEEMIRTRRCTIPVERDGSLFFLFRDKEQDQFVIKHRGVDGTEKVLVDPNPLSVDGNISVEILDVSRDGKILVYGQRRGGQDEMEVRLLRVKTGEQLYDKLPIDRYYGISLSRDNSGFYYARNGPGKGKIFYHALGNEHSEDKVVFDGGPGDERIVFSTLTDDGNHLLITVMFGAGGKRMELYLMDVRSGSLKTVVKGPDSRFMADSGSSWLFIHTDNEAPRGRVMRVSLDSPEFENWQEIIPQSEGVIESVTAAAGHLFIVYMKNVQYRLKVYDESGKFINEITMPHPGTIGAPSGRWNSDGVYFHYDSFVIPPTIYHYDVKSEITVTWFARQTPVNPDDFELKQVWYNSADETKIPMFILRRKGAVKDSPSPTLLTGYGGFGLSRTPSFMPLAVLWADSGGILALPALRGGGEFGREWHQAGMRENKQNVFDDFTAASRYLIDEKYTDSNRLAISGRSNGGLLVGAALTQNPGLYRAVVCGYPLLDMLRFHKFLVGYYWVPEYGNPDQPDDFEYIYKYSPYHNTRSEENYPAVLFVTGDSDTRVAPLHARKMTALLQHKSGSGLPVMLLYDTENGHMGGKPAGRLIRDLADEISFLMWQLGITPPGYGKS